MGCVVATAGLLKLLQPLQAINAKAATKNRISIAYLFLNFLAVLADLAVVFFVFVFALSFTAGTPT